MVLDWRCIIPRHNLLQLSCFGIRLFLLLVVCTRLQVHLQNYWHEPKACLFVIYLILRVNLWTTFPYLLQVSCSKLLNVIWCWCFAFPWRGKVFLRDWTCLARLGPPLVTGKTGSAIFIVIPSYCVLNHRIKEWL